MLFNQPKTSIKLFGKLIDISSPIVMSIINLTPDSFYDKSRVYNNEKLLIESINNHLSQGAIIIDLGGYSSRPGAEVVTEEQELARVLPALKIIKREFGEIPLSLDTFRASVVKEAINIYGEFIVNDISAFSKDSDLLETVANNHLPYILMHSRGDSKTMQSLTSYSDIIGEITQFLTSKINELVLRGISDVIIDIGFGFAKTAEHCFYLLQRLEEFHVIPFPMLVGISRKSFISKTLETTNNIHFDNPSTLHTSSTSSVLSATSSLHLLSLQKGAKILRVHDTLEAINTIKIYTELCK